MYKKDIPTYTGSQNDIVQLASSVQSVIDGDLNYAFTDGHAYEKITQFYDNPKMLETEIDWKIIMPIIGQIHPTILTEKEEEKLNFSFILFSHGI
ncbi:MAG: DUF4433 domain-containing protein [Methanospirillaceae archaeon]|nr:DUF4433 domain-containing protein [Methanospirillaceae archaeon]